MAGLRAAWWWIDRWRKSTAYTDMSLAEQGAYRNLLDELWLRDGVLPSDDKLLGKIAGDVLEWPKVRKNVMARFVKDPETGGWRNTTHDEVAGQSSNFHKSQSDKGKRGAEARWRGRRDDGPAIGPAIDKDSPATDPANAPANGPRMASVLRTPSPLPSPSPSPVLQPTTVVADPQALSTDDDGSGQAPAAGESLEGAYVRTVLDLYRNFAGKTQATRADRRTARDLFEHDVPIETVRAALITAVARRELRTRDEPLDEIGSLAYFQGAIDEALRHPPDASYVEHLHGRIKVWRSAQGA